MQERIVRLETIVEQNAIQYKALMEQLKAVTDRLEKTAVDSNEILHLKDEIVGLKGEQIAQWKKIDSNRDASKVELEKLTTRIDLHLSACPGPARAMEVATEAKTAAIAAAEQANSAKGIPGKFAIAIVGGLLLLFSNVVGGLLLWYMTATPH